MEKLLIWYRLNLKRYIRKRSTWIPIGGLILLILLINSISMPQADNLLVGIVTNESIYAGKVMELINHGNSCFELVDYQEDEDVMADVQNGTLECAFVFDSRFDEKMKKGNLRHAIEYFSSPFSTKGEVAKETLFAALLEYYSEVVLTQSEADLFAEKDPERMKIILEQNERFKTGDELFYMEEEYVPATKQVEERTIGKGLTTQGLIGLFIFLMMFLSFFQNDLLEDGYVQVLGRQEQCVYRILRMYAAVTPLVLAGVLLSIFGPSSRGVLEELFRMLLLILYSGIWICIMGRLPGKKDGITTWFLALAVSSAVICPVFYDLSSYIPALSIIKYCLPLGIYL